MKNLFKVYENYVRELYGKNKMKPLSHKEKQKRKRKRRLNKRR